MAQFVDITGKKYGKLTALKTAGKNKDGKYRWECQCDCGSKAIVLGNAMRTGNTTSCGCVNLASIVARSTKHGRCKSRVYSIFHGMHSRCYDPNSEDYPDYGGRGITVCERWRRPEGFPAFAADMGDPPSGTSIDRIDVNGNYEPGNCKWSTPLQQANNKRNTRLITWRNQTRSLSQWTRLLDRNPAWLFKRLKRTPLDVAMAPFEQVIAPLGETVRMS